MLNPNELPKIRFEALIYTLVIIWIFGVLLGVLIGVSL